MAGRGSGSAAAHGCANSSTRSVTSDPRRARGDSEQANPRLKAATGYAQRGWRVVPLHTVTKAGGCSCGNRGDCADKPNRRGKHPHLDGWPEDATTNPIKLVRWWLKWPAANVGVVCGEGSGIVVLDVDPRNGAGESLAALEAEHGKLPATLEAATGGGGRHLVFQYQPGVRSIVLAPGIELLSDGKQFVVAPSMHKSGTRYRWRNRAPIAPLPAWLLALKIANGTDPTTKHDAGTSGTHSESAPSAQGFAQSETKNRTKAGILDRIDAATRARQGKERRGGELVFCCPAHDDQRPSASWNRTRAQWHCFACGAGGSWRDLATRLGIPTPASGAAKWIDATVALVMGLHWRGLSGSTRRKVLLAVLAIAREAHARAVTISVRQAAERAGVRLETAHRHLTALQAEGWLRKLTTGYGSVGSKYLLTRPPRQLLQDRNTTPRGGAELLFRSRNTLLDTSGDAWRWRALGESARLVKAVLDTGQTFSTATDLARTVGVHRSTAKRVLERLEAHGLALHDGIGWHRGAAELEAVTLTLRTAGAGARQREHHAQERENFRALLVHWRLKRWPRWELAKLREVTGLSADVLDQVLRGPLVRMIERRGGWVWLRPGSTYTLRTRPARAQTAHQERARATNAGRRRAE